MADATPIETVLRDRIAREGPLPFSEVMRAALYDPVHGFYASGGHAGRRGDFLTSPEVGPLFGACVAQAIDRWWDELGRPDPYTVVEAGAGPGTLARAVLAAEPRCRDALRYVAVEVSELQRRSHPSGVVSQAELPDQPFVGLVIANELLDNLPFDLYDHDPTTGWREVRVDADLREVLVPGEPDQPVEASGLATRVPCQREAQAWLASAIALVEQGCVVVIDYARRYPAPDDGWLRTYREHGRGASPLDELGRQDITADVDLGGLAAVRSPDRDSSQADWLRSIGLDELVDEGRRVWAERAAIGDLTAIRARSRIREAEALVDGDGLGSFRVLEWSVGDMGTSALYAASD